MPQKKRRRRPSAESVDAKFQAEMDVRTLMDAEKIKSDTTRLKRAKAEAKKQAAAVNKVAK